MANFGTFSGIEADQEYILYAVHVDDSGKVSPVFASAPFVALPVEPEVVFHAPTDTYRKAAANTNFAGLFTYTGASLSTMHDSDGVLKWKPHNLAIISNAPAAQSITVEAGAEYTVKITGAGSVAVSGAGSGTVTDGSPVTVTASTTTLTLTVTGSPTTMSCYRSDLGGMVNDYDTGTDYVENTTGSPLYRDRRGHHVFEDGVWKKGMLVEPAAATNLLLNNATLSAQDVTVTAQPYTLHFTGTGTVTLSGTSTAGPLVGTGTGEENRVSLTFTPTEGTLTLTVSGTVSNAQLEAGSIPTSIIPTTGATQTRAAETLTIPAANLPWSSAAVWIAMDGWVTYADEGVFSQFVPLRWDADTDNLLSFELSSNGADTGRFFYVHESATVRNVPGDVSPGPYSPGVDVPFSIAGRFGSNFVQGAADGTATAENTSPTSLPDLSGGNVSLSLLTNGNPPRVIRSLRIGTGDIGEAGIEEASS